MSSQAQTIQKKRGGKNAKKQANHAPTKNNTILIKEDGQEYAKITAVSGGCRFKCACFDGKVRTGILRGRLTKGKNKHENFICLDDHVLVGLRDFEMDKCDILLKYTDANIKELIRLGEISGASEAITRIGETAPEDDLPFEFDNL